VVDAYVAIGSNLGPREEHLRAALRALREGEGIELVAVSPVYETEPVGPGPQGPYLNAVVHLRTTLPPRALLARLLAIEAGRARTRGPERGAARTLDLDLLLYGDLVQDEPDLVLPHPRLAERPFVLEPLRDLAPRLVHPVAGVSIERLARRARDPRAVRRLAPAAAAEGGAWP
jgi:2-amino-4-hydroxy-6-hydroxymethyldihydropteridine diphosphokinase